MNLNKHKKVLVISDFAQELMPILQQVTTIQPENILTLQSYGCIVSHPYGDLMRAVVIAIYQENVEEILVVGTKDQRTPTVKIPTQLEAIKDKINTLDYLFQNSTPEFQGGTLDEWLNGKENIIENIEKSVDIIRHHALVPPEVKVRGLVVDNQDGKFLIDDIPTSNRV
ncbi:carbonic anhydrase [Metabacillus niabensis]|uniref:carbonic anhydrase n=1 Tax=Metabacillus niabensis TaxID=324854 RepID=UPI0039A28F71